jgi:hypothetical protein
LKGGFIMIQIFVNNELIDSEFIPIPRQFKEVINGCHFKDMTELSHYIYLMGQYSGEKFGSSPLEKRLLLEDLNNRK